MLIDENVQIFITEGRELLDDMEDALLALERSPNDVDLINRVFRAAHTIKGNAGLFGYDDIVSFTHVAENLLDDVRNCLVPVNDDLISLFMRVKDHIVSLLQNVIDDEVVDQVEQQELMTLLNAFKAGGPVAPMEAATTADSLVDNDATNTQRKSDNWHLSVRLSADTFREGFNPVVMFNQLADLGKLVEVRLVTQAIPSLDEIDSETCYLGWEIVLNTAQDKQAIADVLEFFDGASVAILAPESRIDDYLELLKNLPEDDEIIGQILIEIGSVTEGELQQALNQHKEEGGLTGDILVKQGMVQAEVVDKVVDRQQKIRSTKQAEMSFVRVEAKKLDKLVTLVGELVISGAKVSQLAIARGDDELDESMEEMTLTLENMRETALGLRMVPVANTFNRFQRVVRDIAKKLGKEVRLEIVGGDTELDKTVIERISDPLTHLIRNSMDHGIELPAARVNAGKPAEGCIRLSAYHEAGTIVIEVNDDGKGLDADHLLQIAIDKGMVQENQNLSEKEIYNLIFEAGFSTAKEVSNISGRGVGMDVVRRNIESLKGTVVLDATPGKGTNIRIRLPLTLAIIDGFHVRVASDSFIIPLDMMEECITLNDEQREEIKVHDYINLREEVLPLIRIEEYMSLNPVVGNSDRINVVVVHFAGNKLGLLVDELYGEAQAVIKPLGRVFQGLQGFSGFTILGSGNLALVMDIPDLVKSVIKKDHDGKMDFNAAHTSQMLTSEVLH